MSNIYVPYYRVSTKKQKQSGLGLDAQKAIVEHYANADGATINRVFTETESGKDIANRKFYNKPSSTAYKTIIPLSLPSSIDSPEM